MTSTWVKFFGVRCLRKWLVVLFVVSVVVSAWYFLTFSLTILKCSLVGYYDDTYACKPLQKVKLTTNHPYACNQTHPIQLLIMVISKITHFRQRLTIRQTWGTIGHRSDTKVLFLLVNTKLIDYVVQNHVLQEDTLYGDLIVSDLESNSSLIGHVPAVVDWVFRYCAHAEFLLKVDDESFLNPNRLYEYLSSSAINGIHLVRIPCCKKGYDEVPYDGIVTPSSVSGSLYLIGNEHFHQLFQTAARLQESLSVVGEDAFVDHWAKKAEIAVMSIEGYEASDINDLCVSRDIIFFGRLSENSMRMFWWFVNDERLQNCRDSKLVKTVIKKDGNKVR